MIAALTALGLSGCMHTSGPVAMAQPQSDLDYMAYGQPYNSAPAPASRGIFTSNPGNGGGALAALPGGCKDGLSLRADPPGGILCLGQATDRQQRDLMASAA